MATTGYQLFPTAIGHCGIAWGAQGLTGVQLPERDLAATHARMAARFGPATEVAPPAAVLQAIDKIVALLAGEPSEPADLSDIVLDMAGVPPFHQRVYALGHNPFAPVVPCHRILAADGRAGGFSADGGARTKLRLLEIEGAQFGGPGLFDSPQWRWPRPALVPEWPPVVLRNPCVPPSQRPAGIADRCRLPGHVRGAGAATADLR